jgi:Ca2+-binding RTX toxin-like protein
MAEQKTGTNGNDILDGTAEWDFLLGQGGNDTLNGLAGTDYLDGGSGDDVMNGGDGDDIFIGDAEVPLGHDTMDGGSGSDTVYYNQVSTQFTVDLAAGTVRLLDGTPDTLRSIENIVTGDRNDEIMGSDAANVIDAGAGDDEINGGAGDDHLTGGLGGDSFTGGPGADTFYFGPFDGIEGREEDIQDFEVGIDKIAFWPGSPEPLVVADTENGNTLVFWAGRYDTSVYLLGVTTSDAEAVLA